MARMASLRTGYRAAVVGASGAIGGALAAALADDPEGGETLRLSRSDDGETRIDLFDETSVAAAAERVGEIDLLLIATGALTIDGVGPEKALSQLDPAALARQFATNAIGPAIVLKHFARRLPRGRRALVGVLSARVGSIGDNRLGGWHGYRAAKAALNQFVHGASIEIARSRKDAVVVSLHPGTVESALTRPFRPQGAAEEGILTPEQAAERLLGALDRLEPSDSGGFFDYAGRAIPW